MWWGLAFSDRVVRALLREEAECAGVWVGLLQAEVGSKRSQEASGARQSGRESGGT